MEHSILKQAADFLKKKKNAKRWLLLFLCLAAAVSISTFAALKMTGQAVTKKNRVLVCSYETHKHTKDCYQKVDGEKQLVCGYADFVVHTHNDDCRDAEGKLVCQLKETKEHKHSADCYQTEKVLTCGQEETEGHTHSDKCYQVEKELSCGKEEGEGHTHGDACYDAEGNLTCQLEESEGHTHSDNCYTEKKTLVCEKEESEGHTHSDACYREEKTLVCGELELHTHTEKCYETPEDAKDKDGDGKADGTPICGLPVLEEHIHSADCFREVEAAEEAEGQAIEENAAGTDEQAVEEQVAGTDGQPAEENAAGTDEQLTGENAVGTDDQTSGANAEAPDASATDEDGKNTDPQITDENGEPADTQTTGENPDAAEGDGNDAEPVYNCGLEEHVHGEACYDENGELVCGLEEHAHDESCLEVSQFIKECTLEDIVVTVTYPATANIPENAEFKVTRIHPDGEEAKHYEQRVSEARKFCQTSENDAEITPVALLDIGFYLPDGIKVIPGDVVNIQVQFLGEDNKVNEGDSVSVICFYDTIDVIQGTDIDNDATTSFDVTGLSEFLITTLANDSEDNGSGNSSDGAGISTKFEHQKTIDYLGDGGNNEDTDVDDPKNESAVITDDLYRLYLDMTVNGR